MSSEQLGAAQNVLKGNLGGAWDINKGYQDAYTDLGIARRFGGAAAAYSLRDIGAMNGPVVNVRREPHDDDNPGVTDETDFSASQVSSGALEDWVNGKLESTLPADVATAAAAYSLRKVKDGPSLVYTADFSSGTDGLVPNSSSLFTSVGGFTYEGKSNVAIFTSVNKQSNPQFWLNNNDFLAGFSGSITFEYYVESDSPLVGNKWVVGSSAATHTKDGVTIVGGAWTTATVFFGSYYGGTDKYRTTTGIQELGRILNAVDSNNQSVNCNVGELIAFSSFTASVLSPSAQIRRSSDDIEVNVHFDADGNVSNNSLVSNVGEETTGSSSASTSVTDLNGFLNEKLTVATAVNGTGSFDNYTVTNATTTGFSADNSAGGTGSAGFPYSFAINDVIVVKYTVSNFSSTSSLSPQIRGVTNTNSVTSVASGGTVFTANGTYTDTLTASADGNHLMFADGNTGSYTISDFEIVSHTHSAFVHTWYDQAGSNNATQDTAANQPKIASNGALLADGLLFDGSNDSFAATDITNVNFPATVVSVSETNSTGVNRSLYSLNNDSDACTGFYRSTNKYAINNATTTVEGSATYTTNVHRLKFDLFNGASSAGFSNAVSDISGDIGTTVSQVTHFRIAGSLKSGITTPHSGTIKEIILYTSDQSNNRFKIESNINNYYGLYDDENETNGIFVSSNLNSSFTANGKLGFTATSVSSNDGGGAIELNNTVASGDILYVSFNSTKDSSTGDGVAIRQTSGGTIASNEQPFKSGFNAFTLTANAANADFVVFMDDSGSEFTISDFRVSRIARNGFVETWYDQSNNGNNAVQGTANKQPKIVSNGGTHKLEGLPAINFNDATSHCLTSSNYSRSGSDLPLSMMAVFDKSTTDTDYLFAANKSDDDAFQRLVLRSTTFEYGERDDANTQKVGNGGSPSLDTTFLMSAFTGGTTSSVFINGSSILSDVDTDVGTQTFDQIDIGANNGDGASSNNPFSGNISELYLFETNLSTDRATIEGEIANHYNITLS